MADAKKTVSGNEKRRPDDRRGSKPGVQGVQPYVPTDEDRDYVKLMVMGGLTIEKMAGIMKVSPDTIARHYKPEIETAKDDAAARLGGTLYQRAMRGDNTAAIFWLKTQARWREQPQVVEHSGPGGAPVQVDATLRSSVTQGLLDLIKSVPPADTDEA